MVESRSDAQELIRGAYVSIQIMCHLWRSLNILGSGSDLEPCNLIELRPTVSKNTHRVIVRIGLPSMAMIFFCRVMVSAASPRVGEDDCPRQKYAAEGGSTCHCSRGGDGNGGKVDILLPPGLAASLTGSIRDCHSDMAGHLLTRQENIVRFAS